MFEKRRLLFAQPRKLQVPIFPNFNKVTSKEELLKNEIIPVKLKINLAQQNIRCIFYCLKKCSNEATSHGCKKSNYEKRAHFWDRKYKIREPTRKV